LLLARFGRAGITLILRIVKPELLVEAAPASFCVGVRYFEYAFVGI
jgi:hypothetical protein